MQETHDKMRPVHYVLVILVLLVGIGLRLHHLGKPSLWYDEAYVMVMNQSFSSVSDLFDTAQITDPPVFLLLSRIWAGLLRVLFHFGRLSEASDFAIRLLPFTAGIATMMLVFFVCRRMTRHAGASIVAMYLYAISPFQVVYAQELRNYTVYTAMCLLALWCMIRALEDNRFRHWAGLAFLLIALMYTHYFSIWTVFVFNLYFVLTIRKHWPRLRAWFLCQLTVLAGIVPALWTMHKIVGFYDVMENSWYPTPTAKTALITFKAFFAGYGPNTTCYWALFVLALAFFGLGAYALRRRVSDLTLLLCVAVVPIAGSVIVWSTKAFAVYEHRLFTFSGIAIYFIVAMGICALPKRWMSFAALALFGGFTMPCLADYYAERLHPMEMHRIGIWSKVDYRAMVRYLNEHKAQGDVLGYSGHFSWFSCNYYCDIEQYILGHSNWEQQEATKEPILLAGEAMMPRPVQDVADGAARIWLAEAHKTNFDRTDECILLRRWLEINAFRDDYQVFDGLTLTCYRLIPEARGQVQRDQIADLGDAPLVHYGSLDGKAIPCGQALRDAPATRGFPRNEIGARFEFAVVEQKDAGAPNSREPVWTDDSGIGRSVLAADETTGKALVVSYPVAAEDKFTYRFVVSNPTDDARAVHCTVLESAAVVDPMAYWRGDPFSSVWVSSLQYDCHDPEWAILTPAIAAHLKQGEGSGETIRAPLQLAPGRYTAFVKLDESMVEHPDKRAQLALSIGPPEQTIGELDGINNGNVCGWAWCRAGVFETPGGALTLAVAPYNHRDWAEAYGELGPVLFMHGDVQEGDTPFLTREVDLTLAPRDEKAVDLDGRLDGLPYKRIDIEIMEPATKICRRLTFHVRAANAAPSQARTGMQ